MRIPHYTLENDDLGRLDRLFSQGQEPDEAIIQEIEATAVEFQNKGLDFPPQLSVALLEISLWREHKEGFKDAP